MNKLIAITVAIYCAIVSNASQADSPAWIAPTQVEEITVQPNGNIYIKVGSTVPNLNCPGYDPNWLQLDTAAPLFEQQYALMLSAFHAKSEIVIYVNLCGNGFPYAQNTRLK